MSNPATNVRVRRPTVFPTGDRIAFIVGALCTLILLWVFAYRMWTGVSRDRALQAVPASTPTPPPPPPPMGH